MKKRLGAAALVLLSCMSAVNLMFACGDKFLSVGRGTRLQQPPRGRRQSILIYADPTSDVPAALAHVSVDAALRGAGYRGKVVATPAEFDSELSQGGWDLVLIDLSGAQAVSKRALHKFGVLPVALKATSAEVKQTKKQYPVVLTRAPNNDGFVRAIEDAIASRSKALKAATV